MNIYTKLAISILLSFIIPLTGMMFFAKMFENTHYNDITNQFAQLNKKLANEPLLSTKMEDNEIQKFVDSVQSGQNHDYLLNNAKFNDLRKKETTKFVAILKDKKIQKSRVSTNQLTDYFKHNQQPVKETLAPYINSYSKIMDNMSKLPSRNISYFLIMCAFIFFLSIVPVLVVIDNSSNVVKGATKSPVVFFISSIVFGILIIIKDLI